jgi:hypothetical protein
MTRLRLILAAALSPLLAACGEPSDTTAPTTDPSTGSTTGTSTNPTATEPTTEPTGPDLTCDMFGFQSTGPQVQISLRNDRTPPVYVYNWVSCGRPVLPLEIVDLATPDVPLNWWLDKTEDECSEFDRATVAWRSPSTHRAGVLASSLTISSRVSSSRAAS